MFGKGAGALPTASSILSDIMARRHDYRYEYKKMHYLDRPEYTTDISLKIYVRYSSTDIPSLLPFSKIHEQYISEESCYVIGDINLADLISHREIIAAPDVFLASCSSFYEHLDQSSQ